MTERTPRQPTEAMLNAARDWSDRKYGKPIGNDAAIGCWQAMFDAHTAEQPAPDAVADALEAAAAIADEYASENFRMATDSVLLDRMQGFRDTEERQTEGNGHSAAGITARNIAAAIAARGSKEGRDVVSRLPYQAPDGMTLANIEATKRMVWGGDDAST